MTRKLPIVTAREVIRVAERIGFVFDRQKGSNAVYYRPTDKRRVVIPMHFGREIKPKTLIGIITDMGLTVEDFRKLQRINLFRGLKLRCNRDQGAKMSSSAKQKSFFIPYPTLTEILLPARG